MYLDTCRAWTGSGEKLFDSRREACVKPAIAKIHNTEPGDLALEIACRDSIRGSLVEGLMVIFFVIPRTCPDFAHFNHLPSSEALISLSSFEKPFCSA